MWAPACTLAPRYLHYGFTSSLRDGAIDFRFFPLSRSPPEAEGQKSKDQLPPSIISPRVAAPNSLSRTARMVLTAAKSRKRRFPDTTPPVLPSLHMLGEKSSGFSPPPTPPQEEPRKPHGRRRLRMEPPPGRARGPVLERQAAELGGSNPGIQRAAEKQHDCSNCPICGGYFQLHYLPFHAATCGEEPPARVITVSSSDDSSDDDVNKNFIVPEQPDSRVSCPICGFYFPSSEIQIHANTCGE
ncbi:hypothetical protein XELAEV_18013921mg [Xenopus laevis]|uniref:Uncharacterized protein n=1 Tax=Xenopus laevis TaxID=8355 RepID=A0A974DSJ5_XENLA|nr:hypothetical protein XELAEV_18013921mg [Xenopus laevis]